MRIRRLIVIVALAALVMAPVATGHFEYLPQPRTGGWVVQAQWSKGGVAIGYYRYSLIVTGFLDPWR